MSTVGQAVEAITAGQVAVLPAGAWEEAQDVLRALEADERVVTRADPRR